MLWSSNEVLFLCLIEYSIPIDEAYYLAVYPPSTVNAAPVINRASSLAKNNTALATSTSSPK